MNMNEIIVQNDIQEVLDFTYEILLPNIDISDSEPTYGGSKLLPEPKESVESVAILETKFNKSVDESDKLDYIVAATSGVLTAALDIFWVGEISLMNAHTWEKSKRISSSWPLQKIRDTKAKPCKEQLIN
jgi:hypothetical protein